MATNMLLNEFIYDLPSFLASLEDIIKHKIAIVLLLKLVIYYHTYYLYMQYYYPLLYTKLCLLVLYIHIQEGQRGKQILIYWFFISISFVEKLYLHFYIILRR